MLKTIEQQLLEDRTMNLITIKVLRYLLNVRVRELREKELECFHKDDRNCMREETIEVEEMIKTIGNMRQ